MAPHGSPRIQLLPGEVIRRIAAGEVIERPASVVKELVENAIDAGALHVLVEVKTSRGSISSISVTDDGCGIRADDLTLAVTPHATSKIRNDNDLSSVRSLGFRGEALASIGEVSVLTVMSRARDEPYGSTITVREGMCSGPEEAGAPPGTRVEVSDLFASMPARKKFLKSVATELGRIFGVLESAALSSPKTGFTLLVNGRERLFVDGTGDLRSTVMSLFGIDDGDRLFSLHTDEGGILVDGVLTMPEMARMEPYRLFLVLNGRPVRSPRLQQAVRDAYASLVPRGSWPAGCISIGIDPGTVDVNVHPGKLIVRFEREDLVAKAVRSSVEHALACIDLTPGPGPVDAVPYSGTVRADQECYGRDTGKPADRWEIHEPSPALLRDTEKRLRQSRIIPGDGAAAESPEVIGQIGDLYLVATDPTGALWLVDQHAAHERILYEQVLAATAGSGQELIVPVPLSVSPSEKASLEDYLPDLERAGFSIEPFGTGGYIVRSVPVVLGRTGGPGEVQALLSAILHENTSRRTPFREQVAQVVACRAAIKAGAPCTAEQGNRLLLQLFSCLHPHTCPHGRPTMVRFTSHDLGRMFRRT